MYSRFLANRTGQGERQKALRKRKLPMDMLQEIIARQLAIEALQRKIEVKKCYTQTLGKCKYKGIGEWGTI